MVKSNLFITKFNYHINIQNIRIVYRIKIPQGVKNLFKINNIRVICIENQRFNVFFGWFSSLGLGVFLTSSKT